MDSSTEEAAPDSEMSRYGDYTSMECGNVEYDTLHHASSSGAFTCTVEMEGTKVDMEIDTGASCSVISQKVYDSLESRPPLLRSLRTIKTFTGETVPLVGEADIIVRYGGQQKLLRVVVTKSGPSLLGRNWLEQLKLNWAEIKQLKMHSRPEAAVLADYEDLFVGVTGRVVGMKATLYAKPDCKPKFLKARPVAFALKQKIDHELDRLESEGLVERVKYSKWSSPIVPVLKSDGSVRICGDYKSTFNQAAVVDQYPIPKVEDLLAEMSGGKQWSKLDLTSAYMQLELDEDSKDYTTINTHRGLYRYNRLPFGMSSAPAIFQNFLENLLKSIPFVVVRLDDILVSGKDQADHLCHLQEVFRQLRLAGIHLNKAKCALLADSVVYCGYRIDATGIGTGTSEYIAAQEFPRNAELLSSVFAESCYSS